MTIKEAIDRADELAPNGFTEEQKKKWLSSLDFNIFEKIIKTHDGAAVDTFDGYDKDTANDTELLVAAPYEDIYLYWLWWHFDHANKEYNSYNNNVAMYDAIYDDYAAWYNRTHMPKQVATERYF